MEDDDEPKIWVLILKFVIGAVIFIGGVGLALWYAERRQSSEPVKASKPDWGIVGDSPLRRK